MCHVDQALVLCDGKQARSLGRAEERELRYAIVLEGHNSSHDLSPRCALNTVRFVIEEVHTPAHGDLGAIPGIPAQMDVVSAPSFLPWRAIAMGPALVDICRYECSGSRSFRSLQRDVKVCARRFPVFEDVRSIPA